jgi:phosphonate transport system ATP-binding protein
LKIQIKNLSKVYPNGVQALDNVCLDIPKGSFIAIIGSSGSGKSSLIRCLNRIHEPTAGSIFLDDQDIIKLSDVQLNEIRQKIGMIFQHFNLITRKTVLQNVLLGRLGRLQNQWMKILLKGWPPEWIREAEIALQHVGLSQKACIRADALSGGQQQRVAIARVLFQQPQLLLADEPVASLDPTTGRGIMDDLKKINQEEGVTVMCNLHFLSLVHEYADQVVALKQGQVVFQGSPFDLTPSLCQEIYGTSVKMDYR